MPRTVIFRLDLDHFQIERISFVVFRGNKPTKFEHHVEEELNQQ
jgi:hypothetical protein